jgi:hypothetical protein
MFNLIMFSLEWENNGVTSVPASRIFEYTDQHIIDQFRENGNPVLERCCQANANLSPVRAA